MSKTGTFETVIWRNESVVMLDQRLLPSKEVYNEYRDVSEVAQAIETMVVRGAPAIGIAAAFGVALAARAPGSNKEKILKACEMLVRTRPTAVNLFWAIERMKRRLEGGADAAELLQEAQSILEEDIAACKAMGRHGAELIPDGATVLTHCNAGALATGGWGTALGIIRSAIALGKRVRVVADETRPFLQGARLTAWELVKDGIEVTVISDVAAPFLISKGEITAIVVGTDRVAANGDVANKIGTYGVALAAHADSVPFYVAAPTSTIDLSCPNGDCIPIEERPEMEVTHIAGNRITANGAQIRNPAFDITPFELVTAIVTENGIIRPPYVSELSKIIH